VAFDEWWAQAEDEGNSTVEPRPERPSRCGVRRFACERAWAAATQQHGLLPNLSDGENVRERGARRTAPGMHRYSENDSDQEQSQFSGVSFGGLTKGRMAAVRLHAKIEG